ncbi:MAG: protein kinase [Candidatus Wallbacteria bacterium]|nr:protein kinase [Candidatus Wallbacteria bacterium]
MSAPKDITSLCAGAVVGGYRLGELLGAGGMGSVYRATQLSLAREVALKVLNPGLCADARERERFVQEGVLAARVSHPGIVRVLEVGQAGERLFLAYELISGETLRTRLDRERTLPPADAVEVARVCAEVLRALHESGVLHRDLKPANIFLSSDRGPLVGDLGIAKDLFGGGVRTASGLILGTPAYMAPELASGQAASEASDLYALGIVLFECLAGRPPYESEDPMTTLRMHVREPVPSLSAVRPGLPAAYGRLVARALAKSPAERFRSASELDRALRGLPVAPVSAKARATIAVRVASAVPAARPTLVSSPAMPAARPGRRATPALALALFVACALGALWMRGGPTGAPARLPAASSAPLSHASVAEQKLLATLANGKKLRAHYDAHAATLNPTKLPQEITAIFLGALDPVDGALRGLAKSVASGDGSAALDAGYVGAMLFLVWAELHSDQHAIVKSYLLYRRKFAQDALGVDGDHLSIELDRRLAPTIRRLVEALPAGLLTAGHPAWRGGLACMKSTYRWEAGSIGMAAYAAELMELGRAAFEHLVEQPRLSRRQMVIFTTVARALGNAGIRQERERLLREAMRRFDAAPKPTPSQVLMRCACRAELGKSLEEEQSKILANDENLGRELAMREEVRDGLSARWPYDLLNPPAQGSTPELSEALELHELALAVYNEARWNAEDLRRALAGDGTSKARQSIAAP